jgi:hypothetical protein
MHEWAERDAAAAPLGAKIHNSLSHFSTKNPTGRTSGLDCMPYVLLPILKKWVPARKPIVNYW